VEWKRTRTYLLPQCVSESESPESRRTAGWAQARPVSMILIWTADGGPLQYVGLVFFLIQVAAPQLLSFSIRADGTIELSNGLLITCALAFLLMVFCICKYAQFIGEWYWGWVGDQVSQQQRQPVGVDAGGNSSRGAAAGTGTREDPIVIDGDDPGNNNGAASQGGVDPASGGAATSPPRTLGSIWRNLSATLSPGHFILALGLALPLALTTPLLISELSSQGVGTGSLFSNGVLHITSLALIAHGCMAIAAYRVMRGFSLNGVPDYPGNRRLRRRKLTVAEIADIVRKVPVEEFVSEDDYGSCSVTKLKRMLANRCKSQASEHCVERDDLIREIKKARHFHSECSICAEEFVEGDVLRVTKCQHEFHLHCFDKWVYTFATPSRPRTNPTCPFCKSEITA